MRATHVMNAAQLDAEGAPLPDPRVRLVAEPFEPVIRAFLRVAEAHPDQPAAVTGEVTWSYSRLRVAVLALASELEQLVQPGDAVAVTGASSAGLLALILAVMARNAVLVPIDPLLPAIRRRAILERTGATLMLEAEDPRSTPHADLRGLPIRWFAIPSDLRPDPAVEERAATYRLPEIDGDDPAYIVFTSGTTGEPKGIVGRQRGLSHFLGWEQATTGIGPGDRIGQLTGLSFDVVLRDLLLPLTSGGALHCPRFAPGLAGPDEVLEFLARDRITLIHAVPTVATFWLSDVPAGLALPELRWVLFAGEPLPGALVRRWRERFATPRIGNLYGPTETTLATCFAEIGPEPEPGVQPIGASIPGSQALVMDGDRLCGPDELGEIVIRTPYRSLGYLGAEGQPRPPFVASPFSGDPTDLVYRTGDRGRYRPDGVLEIHGRLDDQVKILGVRVEPAEVAAELGTHPAVRACCVVARSDPQDELALVAYLVPEAAPPMDAELRGYLAERLLGAKVPRLFVAIPELPRTANGKIDRSALPEPDWEAISADPEAACSTDLRAMDGARSADPGADGEGPVAELVSIFREVVGREMGPDDDFFRVGGRSLLAARLVQRIEARTGVRIRMPLLFRHSTPRALAAIVGREVGPPAVGGPELGSGQDRALTRRHVDRPPAVGTAPALPRSHGNGALRDGRQPVRSIAARPRPAPAQTSSDAVIPVRTGGRRPPLFVIAGLGSRVLFLRHLAGQLGEDQPVYALHTRFLEDGSVYERVEDLAARYAHDLRTVQPAGPYQLLGFSYGGLVAFELARQLREAGQDVRFLGLVDSRLAGPPSDASRSLSTVVRSIPGRLLNLAAILQPLSERERRTYVRMRLLIARQNGWAHAIEWLDRRFPRGILGWRSAHPYGPEEIEWLTADEAAWRRYVPRPYPGRVVYFWAEHSQRSRGSDDQRPGWRQLAAGGLDVRPIPGSHLMLMTAPLIRSTTRAIRNALPADGASEAGSSRPSLSLVTGAGHSRGAGAGHTGGRA